MKRESIDAGTQAFWVDSRYHAPAVYKYKGTKIPDRTWQIAQYIQDHAPVPMCSVCHAFGITQKSLSTKLTTLTYLIQVYEDDQGRLHVL